MQNGRDFDDYTAAGQYTINEPGGNSESQSQSQSQSNMYFDGLTATDSDNNYMRIIVGGETLDQHQPVFRQTEHRQSESDEGDNGIVFGVSPVNIDSDPRLLSAG